MKKKKQNGFTLVELVIAVIIFVIAVSVVLSLFMASLRSQRKVIALQNVQDNARFLLGFIAKEIRMSEIRNTTPQGNASVLYIVRPDGENVDYSFNNTDKTIERTDSSTSGSINSEEVLITGSFYNSGIGTGDNQQPRITIVMKVETTGVKAEQKAEINIQTTLNPRNLEI